MAVDKQVQEKQITVAEFEQFIALPENIERHFELIDGEIVEKPMPTQKHGRIIFVFNGELYIYFAKNPIGFGEVEVRYRIPEDIYNSRQPDLAVVLDRETPAVERGAVLRMPDLIVEVKSPDESYTGLRKKAAYYLASGVRMVILVYPEKLLVEIYEPDQDVQILRETDVIDGGTVLPGFTLAVSKLLEG